MDTKDRLQNEAYTCAKNSRHRIPNNYGFERMVLARLFRRENAGVQSVQDSTNNAQREGQCTAQGIQMSRRDAPNTDLIKAVDEGWRYFWKQRGYSHPPAMDESFTFGNEKNKTKDSKQKEAERIKGVQKARREFLEGQGL